MTPWMLVAAIAASTLLVAEGGCRWWVRRRSRYYVWPPHSRREIRLDSEVVPELEPRVRFDINADGERGGDVAGRGGGDGLFRILAAGGSAVECFALDQAKTWTGVLEQLLSTPHALDALGARRVHVGNIGHSGVGSADLDLILERVLPQYGHLDAILIMVGASDVYHWLEDGAPPSCPPSPVPESLLFACRPGQPFGWTPRASALAEVTRRVRRRWLHPVEVKEHAGAWLASGRKMRAEAAEIRTTTPDPAVVLDHFERHFRRLLRRATSHADRVIVMRQPWFEGAYTAAEAARIWHGGAGRPWKETVSVYYDLEVVNRLLDRVHTSAATVADALGVQHITLRPLLTQRVRHYYDHDHFTPAAAALVAHTIATTLLARPVPQRVRSTPKDSCETALP